MESINFASEGLKGRVYEVSLGDLESEADTGRNFRKFRPICKDVQGKD
jgi:ribosomal protein S3AE